MKEKLNNGFKISYIINLVIFSIVLFWIVNMFIYDSASLLESLAVGFVYVGMFLCSFGISLIVLIITILLGINNYKKTKSVEIRKKVTLMLGVMSVIHFIILVFTLICIILD